MGNFTYMNNLEVNDNTISELEIYHIRLPGDNVPVLFGKCAGEANKPYYNELLKSAAKDVRVRKTGRITKEMVEERRDQDRELMSKYVITGWRNVVDENLKPVKFSSEECSDFLKHLPRHVFDFVREHFSDPNNFMGDLPTQENVKKKGKL